MTEEARERSAYIFIFTFRNIRGISLSSERRRTWRKKSPASHALPLHREGSRASFSRLGEASRVQCPLYSETSMGMLCVDNTFIYDVGQFSYMG